MLTQTELPLPYLIRINQICDTQIPTIEERLVDSGMAWRLQGHYGRTAKAVIGQDLVEAK